MYTSIYNPYVPQELFLAHHGILGQRWGKRNGPPYPLGAGDHSASEKKAGWRKSLAGGAVKTAKAIGRGTVKAAKATNKAALRLGIKPKKLMSDEEIAYSINRLKQEKAFKRALKGKFISVEEAERNKGKGAVSQLMGAIGRDVIIPTTVGALRYGLARAIAGQPIEGEKVLSKVETIFGGGKGVGFRNNYFYDKNGNPVFRDNGGKKGKKGGGGNDEPKKEEQPKPQSPASESKPKVKEETPQSSSPPKSSSPSFTRTQQLNARDVLGPVNTRKNASTIISDANQAYNKAWKQGSGYTLSEGSSKSLSTKVGSLNTLVERTFKDGSADQVWKKMQEGKYLPDDETRKFRYGR